MGITVGTTYSVKIELVNTTYMLHTCIPHYHSNILLIFYTKNRSPSRLVSNIVMDYLKEKVH